MSQKPKRMRYILAVDAIRSVSISWLFWCDRMSKSDKNDRVMPIQSWGKSGVLAYFVMKIGFFGHVFWDMDFKSVLPVIYINIKGKTQLEVNWTKIYHIGLRKTIMIKMAISRNAILAKCQSPKSLLLRHFSKICLKFFIIDVNINFGNNLEAEFWSRAPKSKNYPAKITFWDIAILWVLETKVINLGLIDS